MGTKKTLVSATTKQRPGPDCPGPAQGKEGDKQTTNQGETEERKCIYSLTNPFNIDVGVT